MAAPPPPPGYISFTEAGVPPPSPPPPTGYTGVQEPSFGGRFTGQQPGPLIPSATPEQGSILPLRRGAKGPEFDPYAGVLGSLLRGITTPGDVAAGYVPTPYQTGVPNPDLTARGIDTAGVMSPMSPAYRAGSRFGTVSPLDQNAWLAGRRGNLTPAPLTPPPAGTIKEAGSTGYNAVRESGLETPSPRVGDLATDIRTGYGERFSPESAKSTFARLDMMTNPQRSGTSMAALMAHRDDLNDIIARGGSDAKAAIEARVKLDRFLDDLNAENTRAVPGMTPTMTPEEVRPTLETARANTRSAQATNLVSGELDPAVTGFVEKAEGRSGPGRRPLSQQLSDRATALLESNKQIRTFLPDEEKMLESIRDGTATSKALQWWGRKFGGFDLGGAAWAALAGGGGLLGQGKLGAAAAAAALPVTGVIAKARANALAKGQVRLAEELMRSNSPLAKSLAEQAPLISPYASRSEMVTRSLLPGLLDPSPELPQSRLPPGYF